LTTFFIVAIFSSTRRVVIAGNRCIHTTVAFIAVIGSTSAVIVTVFVGVDKTGFRITSGFITFVLARIDRILMDTSEFGITPVSSANIVIITVNISVPTSILRITSPIHANSVLISSPSTHVRNIFNDTTTLATITVGYGTEITSVFTGVSISNTTVVRGTVFIGTRIVIITLNSFMLADFATFARRITVIISTRIVVIAVLVRFDPSENGITVSFFTRSEFIYRFVPTSPFRITEVLSTASRAADSPQIRGA